MCGIIGYVGPRPTSDVILEGLARLEYRGYDSAGLAVAVGGGLRVLRAAGKLQNLKRQVANGDLRGTAGLGHTRWATHGRPTEENAHPHRDCSGRIVVVHNGIIENHVELKRELTARGHHFASETDTEVIAHLLEDRMGSDPVETLRATLARLEGVFAFAVLDAAHPDRLLVARRGAPLVVGVGEGEAFVASDIPAFLPFTRSALLLEDDEMAVVQGDRVLLLDARGQELRREHTRVAWDPIQVEKQGFRHFMLKEIHEQPRALRDTVGGRIAAERNRIELAETGLDPALLRGLHKVTIVACGTSWHAGLVGKFLIERLAQLPVEVDLASEFRYRGPLLDPETLVVGITQSGETADTLAALRQAKDSGSPTFAVCNVVGSMASRLAHHTLYTHAGPEIGVASTKAFTSQLVAMYLFALYLAQERGRLAPGQMERLLHDLARLSHSLEAVLTRSGPVEELAREFGRASSALFLGRGILYPIALEGALKMKEISYVHAEGYPAGEMKHGPIALIDEEVPIVALALSTPTFDKMASNIQEAKARGGRVLALATEGDERLGHILLGPHDHVLSLPPVSEELAPILAVIPLQLLAYHVAVARGCDVDQPRNLAKSVTVE